MSNFDKYQKLCKRFKKQGTPPAPIDLNYTARLYLCFEDKNNDLITRNIDIQYHERANRVFIQSSGRWNDNMDYGNKLPSSGLGSLEFTTINSMVDYNEAVDMFESIVDRSVAEIGDKSNFYEALLDNCVWEQTDDNHPVSTLAVGWDEKAGKFRLYYNPKFVLTGALAQYIYCAKDYTDLEDCYNYMLKFYLIHEMSHITREHMQSGGFLQGVSPQNVNIYGDSFINQVIPVAVLEEQKAHPPIIGILNEITTSGFPKNNNLEYVINDLTTMLKNLTGCEIVSSSPSGLTCNGKKVVAKFVMGDLLYKFPDLNSNLFIREMNNFFTNLFKQGSQDNLDKPKQNQQGDNQQGGQGDDSQGDNSQGGDSGGQGDNQQGGQGDNSQSGQQNQQNGKGSQDQDQSIEDVMNRERDKNQGAQGAKNESEDKLDQQKQQSGQGDGDNQQGDDQDQDSDSQGGQGDGDGSGKGKGKGKGAENAIKDALNKATNEKNLSSKLGGDPLTGDMKAGGDSKGKWRTMLAKAISQATGIKEVYDTNAPHARIQGQFGRDVEVPDFKTVLIMLDCSGSMGAEVFKKVLQELVILESQFKVKPTVYVVYWGSTSTHKRYKMNKNIYKQIAADSKNMGGTYYEQAIDYALTVCKNPDLVIDCTDAEFFENRTVLEKIRKKRMKYNRKTVWVLTKDFDQNVMSIIDPQYKNKSVKLK